MPAKQTKPGIAKHNLDRTERIERGLAVKKRIEERAAKIHSKRFTSMLDEQRQVTAGTLKKYEEEEVAQYAASHRIDVSTLMTDLQLARLVEKLKYFAPEGILDAIMSGAVRLTKSSLPKLLRLPENRIVEELQKLLSEQI
jgi:hypothetical protein